MEQEQDVRKQCIVSSEKHQQEVRAEKVKAREQACTESKRHPLTSEPAFNRALCSTVEYLFRH